MSESKSQERFSRKKKIFGCFRLKFLVLTTFLKVRNQYKSMIRYNNNLDKLKSGEKIRFRSPKV